jgi:hypothetical protein
LEEHEKALGQNHAQGAVLDANAAANSSDATLADIFATASGSRQLADDRFSG